MTPHDRPDIMVSENHWSVAYREKTLPDFLQDFWRARLYWLVGALVGIVCAFIFVQVAIPRTNAHLVVAPSANLEAAPAMGRENLPVIQALAQRFGGGVQSTDFVRFENIYSGVRVAEILLQDPRVVEAVSRDRAFVFSPEQGKLSAAKLSDYIARSVRIEAVKSSSLRRLSYAHPDPAFAVYFLDRVHHVADDLIRKNVIEQAQARSAYLQKSLDAARHPEHRRSLTALLMEQEHLLMLAGVPQPYAAAIVEPSAAFYKPEWPDLKLVFPAFMVVGMLCALLFYGARRALSHPD